MKNSTAVEIEEMTLAIENNDIDSVERLLDQGADINARDSHETPMLHLAVIHCAHWGTADLIKQFAVRGAALECKDGRGMTALTCAINMGIVPAARALLEAGARPNTPGANGWSPLTYAMQHFTGKCSEFVIPLLDHGADLARYQKSHDKSLLHACVRQADPALLRNLLSRGHDPRELDPETGQNALQVAANTYSTQASHDRNLQEIVSILKDWFDCQAAKDAIDEVIAALPTPTRVPKPC